MMKNFLYGVLVTVALSTLSAPSARAEYLPNAEFLAKMEEMMILAEETVLYDPMSGVQVASLKQVRAGEGYREGDVAYFAVDSNGNSFMQLEEWRLTGDGNFRVVFTKIWPLRATRWSIDLTPDRRFLDPMNIVFTEVLWDTSGQYPEARRLPSEDAVEKSERAQELLLKHGRPVVVGDTANLVRAKT